MGSSATSDITKGSRALPCMFAAFLVTCETLQFPWSAVMALWFVWRRENSLRILTALALQHVLDLLTWASYPGQIFPVWTQVNIYNDNLMICNTWTADPGNICEHGLVHHIYLWSKQSCQCCLVYLGWCEKPSNLERELSLSEFLNK